MIGLACAALLIGPSVLAFFSGGYFDEARTWAGLVAFLALATAFAASPRPLPRCRSARVAIVGLVGLGAWTLISLTWAPIAGSAYHAGQRVVLYAGVLIAAAALLRDPHARRATVPALALGATVVVGYGLSERFAPGLLHFQRSVSANGRLEQPLTYWNAMGELAALGFVLCAALAGDATRHLVVRLLATASCALLAMGVYVSFSRGALFALAAGLVALVVLAPRREQYASLLVTVGAGVLASIVAAPFRGVTALAGSGVTRERQGGVALALLIVIASAAAAAQWWLAEGGPAGAVQLPRRAPWIAVALICAGLALAIVIGSHEGTGNALGGGANRLSTFRSNRYAYWDVALRAFDAEPLRGVGAGGWAVWWLRDRKFAESAQDAHSLELQTLAELGLVGVALLGAFIGGVARAAFRAHRAAPVLAAGPIAGAVTYLAHSPLDWDWQMPAVTLIAIVLAGFLLGLGDDEPPGPTLDPV